MIKKLLIKNGTLIAPADGLHSEVKDIYIENGVIQEIGDDLDYPDVKTLDVKGLLVTPGFIDIHTHCFNGDGNFGVDADLIGIQRGTTAMIDAGSSGPDTFESFNETVIKNRKTKVFALLNISKEGLKERSELNSLDKIDLDKVRLTVTKYPKEIVGLKARASASVVGDLGIIPIQMAADVAKELNQILVIHAGNYPPCIKDVLNLMKPGDVLTHAFHGKKGGILTEDSLIISEALGARSRGVLFDIGHGSASFCFKTYCTAQKQGFYPDFISTDLHMENFEKTVYSQHAVVTKLINMGENLAEMISKVTSFPADVFRLEGLGHLKVGYTADISISDIINSDDIVVDSSGEPLQLTKKLVPVYTIVSTEKGSELIENE